MVGMAKLLVQRSKPSGYVYVADWSGSSLQHKMDHLACFIAATLAIGAQDGRRFDAEYMALAEGIGETCYQMYARMKTGLAPEFVQFTSRDLEAGRSAVFNIGRPETVESLFVLWYYTQDPRWREMGWNIFTAFETYAATGSGAPPPAAAAARSLRRADAPRAHRRRPPPAARRVDGAARRQQPGAEARRQDGVVRARRDLEVHLPPLRPRLPDPAREVRDEHRGAPARAHPAAAVGRGRGHRRRLVGSCESNTG